MKKQLTIEQKLRKMIRQEICAINEGTIKEAENYDIRIVKLWKQFLDKNLVNK